ncbi:ABC transporter permease [Microbispora bryophytorum]|uniref:Cytochrome c550 n=2 Tax=Microbispora bryophytorum TaxID=1460882 RepID=A0A8H9H0D4_9ACTN|nr:MULTISPECIES: ABC transporter permease [Microbispora]MBD3136802.1 ABC transporter permease [Microbispora bryophytorum]MBD3144871.1 ABC transporter permease [Microbispora camponoti]TQS06377.1 ABC transporter permease [Microbispora bryophytorum]GGO17115.1 cytochrome c550 [Microbispora bryophytorum]
MTAPALTTLRRTPLRRLAGVDRLAVAGAVLLGVVVLAALLAPWIAPYPGDGGSATHPLEALLPPSGAHWFGTDQVGRDVFSRVLFGARTSLLIAVAVLAVSGVAGVVLGVVAGYAGGWARDVIMRVTDIFLAFPALLLSLALAVVLQPSVTTVIVAIAVTWWPWYARLTASVAASVATRGFVDSARCLGVPAPLIVLRHVLPNSLTPVLVQLSLDGGGVILTAAALSYLGLGAHEPTSEWGLMVQQGQSLFTTDWWVVTFPGLAILVTAFSFNVLGEGLRARLSR